MREITGNVLEKLCAVILFLFGLYIAVFSFTGQGWSDTVSAAFIAAGAAICLALLALWAAVCRRWDERFLFRLLLVLWFLCVEAQVLIALKMQVDPDVDLVHIYKQVVSMVKHHTDVFGDTGYFQFYTNNIPVGMLLYRVFLAASKLMGHPVPYRLVGGLFNVAMIWLAFFFIYQILRLMCPVRTRIFTMGVLLLNPVFYAYASYYYTDTMSLPFLAGGAFFLLRAWKSRREPAAWLLAFAGGVLIFSGFRIRITCLFILLAFLPAAWSDAYKTRRLAVTAAGAAAAFVVVWALYTPLYHHQFPYDTTDTQVPFTHFLMMGSHGRGIYDSNDVKFTLSLPTKKEKTEKTVQKWIENLKANRLAGNLQLLRTKEEIVWGVGTRGYYQYTKKVTQPTRVDQWITGDRSGVFRGYMQAYNGFFFAFLALGIAAGWKKKVFFHRVLLFYWAGAVLFYCLWEAHPRQAVSYLPLLTLLGVPFFARLMGEGQALGKNRGRRGTR